MPVNRVASRIAYLCESLLQWNSQGAPRVSGIAPRDEATSHDLNVIVASTFGDRVGNPVFEIIARYKETPEEDPLAAISSTMTSAPGSSPARFRLRFPREAFAGRDWRTWQYRVTALINGFPEAFSTPGFQARSARRVREARQMAAAAAQTNERSFGIEA